MKISTINKILIALGVIVVVTGVELHVGYMRLRANPAAHEAWEMTHIVTAGLLIVIATWHVIANKWWFKTLRQKAQRARTVWQRIFTPMTALLFLALFATGGCMLLGWYSQHSHIWTWHYGLGLTWAAAAIVHGTAFRRRRAA